MGAKRTLVLHVGMPKTGTTSIQRTLDAQRQQLLDQGVLYPASGRYQSDAPPALKIQHHGFFFAASSNSDVILAPRLKPSKNFEEYIRDLRDEISNTDPKIVLLSSEIVWGATAFDPQNLRLIASSFHDYDIKVLVALRSFENHVPSHYATAVISKVNYSGSLKTFFQKSLIPRRTLEYRQRLDEFADVFGHAAVYAYWFEDVVEDILLPMKEILGVEMQDEAGEKKRENVRKSWLRIAVKRRTNQIFQILAGRKSEDDLIFGLKRRELDMRLKKISGKIERGISRFIPSTMSERLLKPLKPRLKRKLETLGKIEREKVLERYQLFPWNSKNS